MCPQISSDEPFQSSHLTSSFERRANPSAMNVLRSPVEPKVVTTIRAISLFSRICGCQLLCHRRCERLQPIGRPHYHLEVNDLSFSVKLDDIHALHAQRANTGAEFEDDCIVTNKLPMIGKVLQNTNSAAQVEHGCGLAFSC